MGLQNYRELLNDSFIWANFAITAKYVIVSVVGQVVVGQVDRSHLRDGQAKFSMRCCHGIFR